VSRVQFDADDIEWMGVAYDKPAPPSCVTGKVVHRKASTAARIARNMRKTHSDGNIENYACDKCGFFHVGHAIGSRRIQRDLDAMVKKGGVA
jgi:hypothetical protein